MTEEEKEAIENVKHMVEDISLEELIKNKDINVTIYSSGILDILRVIGIVERQQKEIEKLKKLLQKKNKYTHELEKDLFEGCSNYVIKKDEIREKIKELEQYQEQHKKGNWGDIPIEDYDFDKISLLKELLGE